MHKADKNRSLVSKKNINPPPPPPPLFRFFHFHNSKMLPGSAALSVLIYFNAIVYMLFMLTKEQTLIVAYSARLVQC